MPLTRAAIQYEILCKKHLSGNSGKQRRQTWPASHKLMQSGPGSQIAFSKSCPAPSVDSPSDTRACDTHRGRLPRRPANPVTAVDAARTRKAQRRISRVRLRVAACQAEPQNSALHCKQSPESPVSTVARALLQPLCQLLLVLPLLQPVHKPGRSQEVQSRTALDKMAPSLCGTASQGRRRHARGAKGAISVLRVRSTV